MDNLQNKRRTIVPKKLSTEARSKFCSSIQDRFLRDDAYRESQLAIGWSEVTCIKMNILAQEVHSYVAFRQERERCESMWAFSQRSSGLQTAATRDRGDCPAMVTEFRNAKDAVVSSGARYLQFIPSTMQQPQNQHSQRRSSDPLGSGRPDANNDFSRQIWWSSSNRWHGWQSWHSS